jgi:NADH-quinone oxidoreductase subunit M
VKSWPLLTLLTFLPALGGLVLLLITAQRRGFHQRFGLGSAVLTLALAIGVALQFDRTQTGLQFVERHEWITLLGVQYFLGIDGLGLLMVMLTVLIVPFSMCASGRVEKNPRLFFSLVLFLETGLLGTFTALNFFHWFLFWELGLIPAFFLIKLWGGPRRSFAANQFLLYTLVGSVAMLLAFQAIFLANHTFDFMVLAERAHEGRLAGSLVAWVGWLDMPAQLIVFLVFLGVFLGFAVKVPLIPFHIWLPTAYAEAPIGVSMLLTGVMSKMGVYGFLRILAPLFPEQMKFMQTPLLILAVITILYAAWAAMVQTDLKRILAYSSINHLGYCLLGLFASVRLKDYELDGLREGSAALSGVLLQMFNHGLTAASLFFFVGLLEARGGGKRGLEDFGGLRRVVPVFTGLMGIALFSSLGLPGLNGFVSEFLVFKGTFALAPWAATAAVFGLLLTAIFLLTLLQKVFSGPLNEQWRAMKDLTFWERCLAGSAVLLMFAIGLYPDLVLTWINPTVMRLLTQINY